VSLPQKDVEPSALFRKLLEMPAPSEVLDFPRKDPDGKPVFRYRCQVLTSGQMEQCRTRALDSIKNKHGWNTPEQQQQPIAAIVIEDAIAREILCQSCCEVEAVGERDNGSPIYPKLFTDVSHLDNLLGDEAAVLLQYFNLTQAKYGPLISHLTAAQQNAWVERLAEGGSAFPLRLLDSHQRDLLTLSAAKRLLSLCRAVCGQFADSPNTLESLSETSGFDISCFGGPRLDSLSDGDGLDDPDVELTIEMASEIVRQQRGED
jgi:hypothetical protein